MSQSSNFHPLTNTWFNSSFSEPTEPQKSGWPKIQSGKHTLIAAPTGMGKTLTGFFCAIDDLLKKQYAGVLEDSCYVLYISPLKALANDIRKNLISPLQEITALADKMGYEAPALRVATRSGDTTQKERRQMLVTPPHILITTPESLHILLCAEKSREILGSVRTVIVDEIHAISGDKRGAHLSLSLERLERLAVNPIQRIGLSATQKPIERMARVLVGERNNNGQPDCEIVDVGSHRPMELEIKIADDELGAVATHEYWAKIYEMILEDISKHRTTIIFTHTRRLVERMSHQLSEKLGRDKVAAHHGSLSKEARLNAEQRLKAGEIPVIVSSASLELGIDVGTVDLVIHIGAPRVIASLLQRVGRSGHVTGAIPRGYLYPLTRDELFQSAAAVKSVKDLELDAIVFQKHPLDVLSQILVSEAACEEVELEQLWNMVRKSYYYRDLTRESFNEVIAMLAEGIATSRGRSSAWLHYDRVNEKVAGRRGARLATITSGGTIPEAAEYDVIEDPQETFIGRVNEDFAIESMAGNIFLLGNRSWQILRVEKNKVRVKDAGGAPPTIPFWLGEAPSRTSEMSDSVAKLRSTIEKALPDPEGILQKKLMEECNLSEIAVQQMIAYIETSVKALGAIPTKECVIAERFFDEAGGMQLIIHAPFGGRVNRAWALALRKRFCLSFDFELQCAATDDGLIFSLGEKHSFPLDSIWEYLHPNTLEKDVTQAVLPHPIFMNRFRWNAGRSLAVLRFIGGKKVPIHLQRLKTEDLLASVFPAHVGCQDNRTGPIEPVDHPLVNETMENCLHEAMDVNELKKILVDIKEGSIKTLAVESTSPSPFSHEILNASPYAFLDDAPLEERRARAVSLRHVNTHDELGKLDPDVIREVVSSALPGIRDANELHDFLMDVVVSDENLAGSFGDELKILDDQNRVSRISWEFAGKKYSGYTTAEKKRLASAIFPEAEFHTTLPDVILHKGENPHMNQADSLQALLMGWMEILGPVTVEELSGRLGINTSDLTIALTTLETQGIVMQGNYSSQETQWCARNLLMRIHHRTVQKLRKEIEPVSLASYMEFLFHWQHLDPSAKMDGYQGLSKIVEQLQGLEIPFSSWEPILKVRMKNLMGFEMDSLFTSGNWIWCRAEAPDLDVLKEKKSGPRITRNYPVAFISRRDLAMYLNYATEPEDVLKKLDEPAKDIYGFLMENGASFTAEISAALGKPNSILEEGFKTLIRLGLISGDGLGGIKTLLTPVQSNRSGRGGYRSKPAGSPAGRWYLFKGCPHPASDEERLEAWTWQLLKRYGIVLREVTLRENHPFPWWQILRMLRRMEARGEIRGGRFVNGIPGEQFAMPEALQTLKSLRKEKDRETVVISAADPLNLTGILVPGNKIPVNSNDYIAFKGGIITAVGSLGKIKSVIDNQNMMAAIKLN